MTKSECLQTIEITNGYLRKELWMFFEVCRMDQGEIILSGRIDEQEKELIEISFIQPYMISCLMGFIYEEGVFITLVQGEEELQLNKKYDVEQGNYIFRLSIDGIEGKCFIIAKEISIKIMDRYSDVSG